MLHKCFIEVKLKDTDIQIEDIQKAIATIVYFSHDKIRRSQGNVKTTTTSQKANTTVTSEKTSARVKEGDSVGIGATYGVLYLMLRAV